MMNLTHDEIPLRLDWDNLAGLVAERQVRRAPAQPALQAPLLGWGCLDDLGKLITCGTGLMGRSIKPVRSLHFLTSVA